MKNLFNENIIYQILKILLNLNNDYGDWGLGIGAWAPSPIPNPQSPIPNPHPHI